MSPKFNMGDVFSGPYEFSGVHKETGELQVFQDTLSYTVLDVNYAVAGSKRYQNVSMNVSYKGGQVVAGFYDRCTRTGQLNENKPLLDPNVVKISQISLSADGKFLTVQFAKNSVKSPDYDAYTFTAVLPKQ